MRKTAMSLVAWMLFACTISYGQSGDSTAGRLLSLPTRFFDGVLRKTSALDRQLSRKTEKYLAAAARQEQRLRKRLSAVDSAGSSHLFAGSELQYTSWETKLKTDTGGRDMPMQGAYMPYIDSLKTSLAFLRQHQSLMGDDPALRDKLQQSLNSFQQLQAKMLDADQIRQFLQQRKEQMRQYLQQYTQLPTGVTSAFEGYKKQAYYYGQQLQSYKDVLNDPDKLLKAGLGLMDQLPAFRAFMAKNSMLAGLFNVPSNAAPGAAVQGMATRDQVMAAIQGPSGATNPAMTSALQQNIQTAQGQVDGLRDKLPGAGGSDLNMPDFKPNDQKTRSFWRRLEYGTNLQSAHSTPFFPTTTDFGLSIGYKIDSKNVLGVGASYKIGWGGDIQHIHMSGQGVGLRSFADIRIKNTWYASGGFEYNYQRPFDLMRIPWKPDAWQQSGLIGISKIVAMKTKSFKKMKLQLLWDFLSYRQIPRPQPLKFRIAYSF
jgi:hypothetical protein